MKISSKLTNSLALLLIYIFLIILACISFFPFILMFINATHSSSDIVSEINFLPGNMLMENYKTLQTNINIWSGFRNSVIISVVGTLFCAYIGSLAAYAFSKYKFKGRKILFWMMMSSMMVPPQIGLIGYFDIVIKLGLYDNILAVLLVVFANATLVFFVKLYIDSSLSNSVIESARIDGANEFVIFNKIVLPIIIPSIATMGIFVFIFSWNNFLAPSVVLTSEESKVLPILIAESKGVYNTRVAPQYVAVSISVIPIMMVFVFFSKYIISGLTSGAIKG